MATDPRKVLPPHEFVEPSAHILALGWLRKTDCAHPGCGHKPAARVHDLTIARTKEELELYK